MLKKSRTYINGFSRAEFARIVGLSTDMVEYLARQGYLAPTYRARKRTPVSGAENLPDGKGVSRYYSYRDLVVGRAIQQLCEGGVALRRLKKALVELRSHKAWTSVDGGKKPEELLKWIVFDGKDLMLANTEDRNLDPVSGIGQRSFGFLISIDAATTFVRRSLEQIDPRSAELFTFEVNELIANDEKMIA